MFDPIIYNQINKLGIFPKTKRNKICFFGDKKKVLYYDLEIDEWNLTFIP